MGKEKSKKTDYGEVYNICKMFLAGLVTLS